MEKQGRHDIPSHSNSLADDPPDEIATPNAAKERAIPIISGITLSK